MPLAAPAWEERHRALHVHQGAKGLHGRVRLAPSALRPPAAGVSSASSPWPASTPHALLWSLRLAVPGAADVPEGHATSLGVLR